MSDEQRRELEWPSEDLAQAGADRRRGEDVEWPSVERTDGATRPEPTTEPPAEHQPGDLSSPEAETLPPQSTLQDWPPNTDATTLDRVSPAQDWPPNSEPPAQELPPSATADPHPPASDPLPLTSDPLPPASDPLPLASDPLPPASDPLPLASDPLPPIPAIPAPAPAVPPTLTGGYPPAPPDQLYSPAPPGQPYPPAPPDGPYAPAVPPSQGVPPPQAAPPPFAPPSAAPGPYTVASEPGAPTREPGTPERRRDYFRPDIEGLRAVAVVAVLLFHVGLPFASGGYVGVDVFYVISGFLITGLLLREGEERGRIDLIRFYARRMRRLLPAALLVIVVTLAASAAIVSPLRLTEIAGDAAASALYVANFRFAFEAADYLALEAPSPLLHYWSLGVEEQFYLAWPLLLLLATRILPTRLVGLFFLVLAVASFGLSLYLTDASQPWAFFSPFTRAWELAAGALIAVGLLSIPARVRRPLAPVAAVAGLALILAAVVLLGTETPFPGVAAVLPVAGATLVILAGVGGESLPAKVLLSNPVSRYLGRISYSLYLWHWPLLILVPLALENDDITIRLALAGVAIVLAALSTELVEQPFRRGGVLAQRPRIAIQLGLSGSVAVGFVALLMSGAISLPALPVRPDPVVLELAAVREDLPRAYRDGCHLTIDASRPREDCVYGDPEGERTAFLVGDSHAAQWIPALDRYAADRGWRLEVHTKAACSVADVPLWERRLLRLYDECFDWRARVIKRVRQALPEVVFVGSSRDYELLDASGEIIRTNQAYTYWREQLTALLSTFEERARRVVLLAETPFLNFDPVDCLASETAERCHPAASLVIDRRYAELEAAAAEAAGASVLSANDLLCPGANCLVVADDIVVFRDRHHVTATYMEHLAEPIANLLEGRPPYPDPSPRSAPVLAGS